MAERKEIDMKKKIVIAFVLVFAMVLTVIGVTSKEEAYAKSAQMHIEIPESIKKENEFQVTVVLESDVQLYSVDAYISYDANMLEFISDNDYVTGSDGVLELKDVYQEETKNATYEITFKALEAGVAEVALTDVYLIDYADLDYITVSSSAKQLEIGVNHMIAEDARLSDLIIAPGVLEKSFDPNVLEYVMYVGLDVEQIGVSAIPMNVDSVVGLVMPDTLQIGENIIKITVTALSGNVNMYTVTVIREAIEKSSDEKSVDDISTAEEEGEGTTEEIPAEEIVTEESTEDDVTKDDSTKEEAVADEAGDSTKEETVTGENTTQDSANEEVASEETVEYTEEKAITE